MEIKGNEAEFNKWFSTYGLITSERVLGSYNIHLPKKEQVPSITTPTSFYRRLLQIPLKNVLNGIILQQANDYHIYAQKLFIDYLLSGESAKPPESQGAMIREEIETERQALVALGDELNQAQLNHDAFISESQKKLIELSRELQKQITKSSQAALSLFHSTDLTLIQVKDSIVHALIYAGFEKNKDLISKKAFLEQIKNQLNITLSEEQKNALELALQELFHVLETIEQQIKGFTEKVQELTTTARTFRTQFYNSILRILELMNLLPEYRIDQEQDAINRSGLVFDRSLGETSSVK